VWDDPFGNQRKGSTERILDSNPGKFSELKFPIEKFYPMQDPAITAVKYRGQTTLKDSGNHYNNEYFALFVFDEDGKIKEYHEYSNPIITAKSFNMVDKVL
jgi:ketosteroid isomerase-like protein